MRERDHDRRATVRVASVEDSRVSARVRPGHQATVLNVSAGGALIETAHRLLPGRQIELHMETKTRHAIVRGRVVRCSVIEITRTSVCYRGAIAFDRHLPWFVDEGNVIPNAEQRAGRPSRADDTRAVV